MQRTDSTYDKLIGVEHYSEIKVTINGVEFGEDQLLEVRTDSSLFPEDTLSIGGALQGSVTLRLHSGDQTAQQLSRSIPKAAEIVLYERICGRLPIDGGGAIAGSAVAGVAVVGAQTLYGDTKQSGWLVQGVYYIDEREAGEKSNILEIVGLDKMVFAEADYPDSSGGWPQGGKKAIDVVLEIASAMGVTVSQDSLKLLHTHEYKVQFPSAYSMREVLGYIAAMYCGNFYISKDGQLTLVGITSLPDESYFLLDHNGRYIYTINSEGEEAYIHVG